jgi:WD40 repeat protein
MLMLLDGEPERPRLVNPKIPRDMQTICLKCLEKDASKRYSSAASLAEDLESWLNGRPISARPVSGLERAWRWCRRNPTLAAVPAVALAIIVLLTGVYYGQLVNKNRETRRSHDRTQDALARSLYEQARATRVSGELGRRWEVFRLLGKAEALRGREREFPTAPPLSDRSVELESLPSIADLRSEAIAASLLIDARMFWELRPESGAQPALSCDGRLAAVLWRGEQPEQPSVAIIDTANRGTPRQFNNQEMVGTAFALSPDGKTLASFVQQGAEKINLWRLTDGRRIAELDWPELPGLHDQPPAPGLLMSSEMSFSPDGRYLTAVYRLSLPINAKLDEFEEIFATSNEDQDRITTLLGETIQTIVLWDIEGDAEPQSLATTLQNTDRGAAVFSPNGTLVGFATGERTVRLRNLQSEREPVEVQLPLPLVGKFAFNPDGRWLVCPCRSSTARRGAVVVWDLAEDRELMRLDTDFSLTAATSALSPDGDHLALGTRSGRIVLFHLARRKMVVDIKAAHRATVAILRWSTNSRHLLSWGIQGTLKRWQLAERSVSDGQSVEEVFGFALSPDAQWLAYGGGPKGRVQLVDRRTGLVVRTLAGYEFPLPGLLLFSHDSRRLAQVGAYQAVVWDVMTGQEVTRLEERSGLTGRIGSVAFNNRGALLACVVRTNDPILAVWDLIDRRAIWQPEKGKYDALHLTPDGRLLAGLCSTGSTAGKRVVVLEIPTGRAIGEIELAAAPFGPQTFTPEGRWLVTTDFARPGLEDVFGYFPSRDIPRTDTELNLQSFPAGAKRLKIVGPSVPTAIAVNPDGRLLAIGYQDGSVKLWGLTENEEILRADFCAQAVSQLAFMPDGRSLVITDGTSPVQFLDLSMLRRQLGEIGLDW